MSNGMDDNVPDVCKVCHHIISPEEDAPEETCEKCQRQSERDAEKAFVEKLRKHYTPGELQQLGI